MKQRPDMDWVCATIPLTHKEAIEFAKNYRKHFLPLGARWRVSKTKPTTQ
jgi:hypothetical protein